MKTKEVKVIEFRSVAVSHIHLITSIGGARVVSHVQVITSIGGGGGARVVSHVHVITSIGVRG